MLLFRRFLHSTCSLNASGLAELRKRTGYSMINCKNALTQFEGDVKKAEEWLREQAQKEGWAKATKLQDRDTSQGLLAAAFDKNKIAIVEVNCETDFVARNAVFQGLAAKVASELLNQHHTIKDITPTVSEHGVSKEHIQKLALNDIFCSEDKEKRLIDLVALNIGTLGENIGIRRGCCVTFPDDVNVTAYGHPSNLSSPLSGTIIGKYVAIVGVRKNPEGEPSENPVENFCRGLCQHVVGMKPETIGSKQIEEVSEQQSDDVSGIKSDDVTQAKPNDVTMQNKANDFTTQNKSDAVTTQSKSDAVTSSSSSSSNEDGTSSSSSDSEDEATEMPSMSEKRLLQQKYLLDPELTVLAALNENGLELVDFVRFEIGESLPQELVSLDSKE